MTEGEKVKSLHLKITNHAIMGERGRVVGVGVVDREIKSSLKNNTS